MITFTFGYHHAETVVYLCAVNPSGLRLVMGIFSNRYGIIKKLHSLWGYTLIITISSSRKASTTHLKVKFLFE